MKKEHPIDRAVRGYRAIQHAACARPLVGTIQAVFPLCILALLLLFGFLIWVLPHKTVSTAEKRTLAPAPTVSLSGILSGELGRSVASFCSDHFPLRTALIRLKAGTEIALLKQENNSILLGQDGYLIDRIEYTEAEYAHLRKNLDAVLRFRDVAAAERIPLTLAVAPRTVDVLYAYLPPLYSPIRTEKPHEMLRTAVPDAIDLAIPLRAAAAEGFPVMYRTDHHWTTDGAYLAYTALADALGFSPLPASYFQREAVTSSFFGTTHAASGAAIAVGDSIVLYRAPDDSDYTVTVCESGKRMTGFYDRTAIGTGDDYRVFLGGNSGLVTVQCTKKQDETDRPNLLLIKDSFALSVVPFLARHYDITLVDPRYFSGSTAELLLESDAALILTGIDTLSTSDVLTRILYGIRPAHSASASASMSESLTKSSVESFSPRMLAGCPHASMIAVSRSFPSDEKPVMREFGSVFRRCSNAALTVRKKIASFFGL
jgi:hypothetical protein